MTSVKRQDVDDVIRRYGSVPPSAVPWRYRDPKNERDFQLGIAIVTAQDVGYENVHPVYDENDELLGWKGLKLKNG